MALLIFDVNDENNELNLSYFISTANKEFIRKRLLFIYFYLRKDVDS